MWRNLGENLGEHNAERTTGTLESWQLVCKSVDRDYDLKEEHLSRGNPREEEAVFQNITDLLTTRFLLRRLAMKGMLHSRSLKGTFCMALTTEIDTNVYESILIFRDPYTNKQDRNGHWCGIQAFLHGKVIEHM